MAPADMKKEGRSFDSLIGLAMLAASEQIAGERPDTLMMVGELALDGVVRPAKGVLPIALGARQERKKAALVSPENGPEAAVVEVRVSRSSSPEGRSSGLAKRLAKVPCQHYPN